MFLPVLLSVVAHGTVLLGQFEGALILTPNTVWNSITNTCVFAAAREWLCCPWRPEREIPTELLHAVMLQSLCSLVPGSMASTGELGTKLGFPWWVEWHQFTPAGNPAWFYISLDFRAVLLGVYKVADACKGKARFPQLTFTDPGELLNNLRGVCQLDRKDLPWISASLFALLLWSPGSNHSRN